MKKKWEGQAGGPRKHTAAETTIIYDNHKSCLFFLMIVLAMFVGTR